MKLCFLSVMLKLNKKESNCCLYLFILVLELLGKMVFKAEFVGLLEGFSSSNGGPLIPFIEFAYDSFLC